MTLPAGARLGPYEVVAPLGAGGMGEVYRAKDPKLGRDVAIKVLPARTAEDPEALARFEREARAVAALSHPNILSIHDIGRVGDAPYAVMELLEGETLRERLEAGALPPRRALDLARQIAAGLAAAHERGIVHRDLKPENLFVLRDGRLKILDFGLAKQTQAVADTAGPETPTRSISTDPGVVMGTAGYMSPEQVRGHEADARSDLFAFGAVLYEMLSGVPAFRRATAADTMSAVLREEPPELPAGSVPLISALDRITRRCLEKDPVARFHSASDLAFNLDSLSGASGAVEPRPGARAATLRERWLWASLLVALVAAGGWVATRHSAAAPSTIRATVLPPDEVAAAKGGIAEEFDLSPDGRQLVFVAAGAGQPSALWVRPLDSVTPRKLEGTDHAGDPFWSADGLAIGFFAEKKLKIVPAKGGMVTTLCDADTPAGGTWLPDGTIVFGGWSSPLTRIPASGGTPTPLLPLDKAHEETGHAWPRVLPDGRHIIFYVNGSGQNPDHPTNALWGVAADGKDLHYILKDNGFARYADGTLFYINRRQQLMAIPLDPDRLQVRGTARIVQENVGCYAVSAQRLLVYRGRFAGGDRKLAWYDASGRQLKALGEFDVVADGDVRFKLSPDDRWLCLTLKSRANENVPQLWLLDTERGVSSQFVLGDGGDYTGVWAPSSDRVYFTSGRNGFIDLYEKDLAGGDERPLLVSKTNKVPAAVTPDGKTLVYYQLDQLSNASLDVFTLPLDGAHEPRPLLRGRFNEIGAYVSPDGRRAFYYADESGDYQLYVAGFPDMRGARPVTPQGAWHARWRPDGGAILYPNHAAVMSVEVRGSAGRLEVGEPRTLFSLPAGDEIQDFDVSSDGKRFIIQSLTKRAPPPLTLVSNWEADLRP